MIGRLIVALGVLAACASTPGAAARDAGVSPASSPGHATPPAAPVSAPAPVSPPAPAEDAERVRQLRARLCEMPLILLQKEPDMAGTVLDVQSFTMDGVDVVPLFTSEDTYAASVRGANLGLPRWQIHRELLASTGDPRMIYLLDPTLTSEWRFTGAELSAAFPVSPGSPMVRLQSPP